MIDNQKGGMISSRPFIVNGHTTIRKAKEDLEGRSGACQSDYKPRTKKHFIRWVSNDPKRNPILSGPDPI
jgi:hypothetical protein